MVVVTRQCGVVVWDGAGGKRNVLDRCLLMSQIHTCGIC